ncbi:MAG: hypothetical protein WDA07_13750 [Leucobacter sp.]
MTEGSGKRRRPRRVTRPAPDGVDPRPSEHPLDTRAAEDRPEGWGDGARPNGGRRTGGNGNDGNDDRLCQDRPPHWG